MSMKTFPMRGMKPRQDVKEWSLKTAWSQEERYIPLRMISRTAVMPTSAAFYESRFSNMNLIKYKFRSVLHNKNLNYRLMKKLNGINCLIVTCGWLLVLSKQNSMPQKGRKASLVYVRRLGSARIISTKLKLWWWQNKGHLHTFHLSYMQTQAFQQKKLGWRESILCCQVGLGEMFTL